MRTRHNQAAIDTQARYQLAENIGFFLVSKGLKTYGEWSGKLTKKEQIQSFGFYIGKGTIYVCGKTDTIQQLNKIAFGLDSDIVFSVSASCGWLSDNRGITLNVFNTLNAWLPVSTELYQQASLTY